jgi:hypothetical protein
MPTDSRYFLVEKGQRTGPHSMAVLRQKADIYDLTPDTPIAAESAPEAWTPLRDLQPLCNDLIPPRPQYTLGAHAIERVNSDNVPAAPSVQEILRANAVAERAAEGEFLKQTARRRNRRLFDYLLLAISGNLVAVVAWLFLPTNPMVLVPLLAFAVIYNIGIAWVMFGVMDRY